MTTSHDSPARVIDEFLAAFNSGDATALEPLYEADAVMVPRPGMPVTGRDLSAAIGYMLRLGKPMRAELRQCYVAGDIALLVVDWSIPDTELAGTASDVLRRGPDGKWRYAIDNPMGTA